MELQDKLAELVTMVEGARAMPMSASCILNRGELLKRLEAMRALVPETVVEAQALLEARDDVVEEGRREAERLVAEAREERDRLVSEAEVYRQAQAEAENLRAQAANEAAAMRGEVEDYVDGKLANFEIVLNKTLAAVLRGREKLGGHRETHGLSEAALAEAAAAAEAAGERDFVGGALADEVAPPSLGGSLGAIGGADDDQSEVRSAE